MCYLQVKSRWNSTKPNQAAVRQSPVQLYSSQAGKRNSCPSLAETSICLNYSICAASKCNREKRLASKWKGKGSVRGCCRSGRHEKTAIANEMKRRPEQAVQGSSKSKTCTKSAPGGRAHADTCGLSPSLSELILGGASPLRLKVSQQWQEIKLIWDGCDFFNESFNGLHYFVWYNHSLCF